MLCCFSGAELVPVASLSNVGLFGLLRLVLSFVLWLMVLACYCAFDVWRVLERRCNGWRVLNYKFPRVFGWGMRLIKSSPRAWVLRGTSFGSGGVAALSSGAWRLVAFVIP